MKDEKGFIISTDFWADFLISPEIKTNSFHNYFGNKKHTISNLDESSTFINEALKKSKNRIIKYIMLEDIKNTLFSLHLLQNIVYQLYIKQKEQRIVIKKYNINDLIIIKQLMDYSQTAKHLLDSINLWIENSLLLNQFNSQKSKNISNNNQQEFVIDLYVYGVSSYVLTLIEISKTLKNVKGIKYLDIDPKSNSQINPRFEQSYSMFYSPIVLGNQGILIDIKNTDYSDNSSFNLSFKKHFNNEFMDIMALFGELQKLKFDNSNYPINFFKENEFIDFVTKATIKPINYKSFSDKFILTREKINTTLDDNSLRWKMFYHKMRLELCPIILLDNEVIISNASLSLSITNWFSCLNNGGMIYSDIKDDFNINLEQFTNNFSKITHNKIKNIFENTLINPIIYENIKYDRIWTINDINYGDYDLIIFSPTNLQVYICEVKYVSDSLNPSAFLRDLKNLFEENGHYSKFKRRCDLVKEKTDDIKRFLKIEQRELVNFHFLYITSKPMQTNLLDKDKEVFFLCLKNLKDYIDRRFIDNNNKIINSEILI